MADPTTEEELRPFFVPRYGELSLILMGASAMLVLAFYDDVRSYLFTDYLDSVDPRRWLIVLFFVAGLLLCIRRIFTSRPRSLLEKLAMLFFAVFANGFAGIAAGIHLMGEATNLWFFLLPLWNCISAGMLLLLYRLDVVNENAIVDDCAPPREVALSLAILLVAFVLCRFVFDLYWAVTFSACVVYASSLSGYVADLSRWLAGAARRGSA